MTRQAGEEITEVGGKRCQTRRGSPRGEMGIRKDCDCRNEPVLCEGGRKEVEKHSKKQELVRIRGWLRAAAAGYFGSW